MIAAHDIDPGIAEAFASLSEFDTLGTPSVSLGVFDDHPHPVDEVLERMMAAGVVISDDAKARIRETVKKKLAIAAATRGVTPGS